MIRFNTFLLLIVWFPAYLIAQDHSLPASDTASWPYWIGMMQDPEANFFKTRQAFETYWKDRPVTRSSGYKVFKRWEYFMENRVSPDGTRPAPEEVVMALNAYLDNNRSVSGNWTSLGPSQIPAPGPAGYEGLGRLNTVAFHPADPNKLYVGAPSGGMWQTSDGGLTWTTYTDTLPTLGVSSILIDHSDPSRIFIGTGDRDAGDAPGLGVFLSTDGGLSWAPSKTGMGDKTVGKLIQHPLNANQMFAATSGGIYRSDNGGSSWSLITSGNFKDLCFKPNDPSILYAAQGADFYRSSNGGGSFVKITAGLTSGQRGVIAVTPANPNYVYFVQSNSSSGFKGLYRSTDAGLTFTTRSTSPNILDWSCDGSASGGQGWYDLAIAADPVNPELIYVGGVNVWKSTNGGTSWNINAHWYGGCSVAEVHADCHYLAWSPVDGKLYACNDGGIYFTSNGTTWTDRTVTMTIGQIYKLGQSQTSKEKVINGFQDNGTYTYLATGWIATGGGDGMECAVDYQNGSYMYHTIYYGDIYRTFNNGNELHVAGNGVFGINESGGWVTPFILGESDPKMMFVGYKNIWRCNDVRSTNNPTWSKISNNLAGTNSSNLTVLEQSPANPGILYAARSDNKLFRTDNALAASPVWTDLTSLLPATGTPSDLEAHSTDPGVVYMTLGNNVYKSVNNGQSWTTITGNLPALHMNSIVCYKNGPEALYVGTDAGVFFRDSSSTGWSNFSAGLPYSAEITELEIYYDNDSTAADAIRASTYGRGLWGSDLFSPYQADFTADSTQLCAGNNADFTDLSPGSPVSWSWSFPGGTPSTSAQQHPQDIAYYSSGTYDVSLNVNYGSFTASSLKQAFITVNQPATAPSTPSGDTLLCQNSPGNAYTTGIVPGALSYNWELLPSGAGTITGNDTTGLVTWDPLFTGIAEIRVQSFNDCGGSWSPCTSGDQIAISYFDPTGITSNPDLLTSKVIPNPNSGRFSLFLKTSFSGNIQIRITDLMGNILYDQNKIINGPDRDIVFNLESLREGIYFLSIKAGEEQVTHKLIIKH